jgi:hypothetical protein
MRRHAPRHALRDLRHRRRPVNPDEAKTIIAQHWTVPADVRARRRNKKNKKKGKAAKNVLAGQSKPRARSAAHGATFPGQHRTDPTRPVNHTNTRSQRRTA